MILDRAVSVQPVPDPGVHPPEWGDPNRFVPADIQEKDPVSEKPFAFRLTPAQDPGTMMIYFGKLLTTVTYINFERKWVDGQYLNVLRDQDPIPGITAFIPDQMRTDYGYLRSTLLPWRGKAYLYWETDGLGKVTKCEIVGPGAPDSVLIPYLDNALIRTWAGPEVGKYSLLLGEVLAPSNSGQRVIQEISSDVTWAVTIIPEGDGSSSDESSSDSGSGPPGSGSGSGSDAGSDKSTAIVRASWSETGYTALFVEESPEVRFNDYMQVKITKAVTKVRIDPRFVDVCVPDSIWVCGICGNKARGIGAEVKDGYVTIRAAGGPYRSTLATIHLTGIRRGFAGMRFPNRTRRQYVANEKFINSAYPK